MPEYLRSAWTNLLGQGVSRSEIDLRFHAFANPKRTS